MVLNAAHKIASVIGDYFSKKKNFFFFILLFYSTGNKNVLEKETRFWNRMESLGFFSFSFNKNALNNGDKNLECIQCMFNVYVIINFFFFFYFYFFFFLIIFFNFFF